MRHGAIYCIVFIVNINININIRLNVSASTDTIHITSIPQETSARVTTGAATSRRQEEGLHVMVFALLFVVAFAITMILAVDYGLGRHIWDIPLSRYIMYLRITFIESILYICGTALMKISIILFYLRIFPPTRVHIVCKTLIFFILGYSFASCVVVIFMCRPVEKFWDVQIMYGSCIDRAASYYVNAAMSITTDMMTLAIPIPLIHRLTISLRQKIIIACILGMGSFVFIVSVVRVFSVHRLFTQPDSTWNANRATILSILEIYVGILLGSAPTLRPLFLHFIHGRQDSPRRRLSSSSAASSQRWLRCWTNVQRRLSCSTSSGSGGAGAGTSRCGSLFKNTVHVQANRLDGMLPPREEPQQPPLTVVQESYRDMRRARGTLGRHLRNGLSGCLRQGRRRDGVDVSLERYVEDDGGGSGDGEADGLADVEAGAGAGRERTAEDRHPLELYMIDEEMDAIDSNATVTISGSRSRSPNM
ncbi:hypothetical protein PABG_06489 [Paracoccidioides brasiliensis Pb03]|nr:hypothetical protein PABG_06489 [Paracoccidioides brasiliensis Pb03]